MKPGPGYLAETEAELLRGALLEGGRPDLALRVHVYHSPERGIEIGVFTYPGTPDDAADLAYIIKAGDVIGMFDDTPRCTQCRLVGPYVDITKPCVHRAGE